MSSVGTSSGVARSDHLHVPIQGKVKNTRRALLLVLCLIPAAVGCLAYLFSLSDDRCKSGCLPYQVKECLSWKPTVICYTDKPGLFAERPRK